jgi:hypothetical protein
MPDPQDSKKSRRFFGLRLPERPKTPSPRQPSPQPPVTRYSSQTVQPTVNTVPLTKSAPPSSLPSPDRQQTKTRFVEAYHALRTVIEKDNSLRPAFEEFSTDPEGIDDSIFINALNRALEYQNSKIKDRSAWGTCKSIVKYLVHTFKPFAKNFLMIARDGSSVRSFVSFLIFADCSLEPVWIIMQWIIITYYGLSFFHGADT